MSTVLATDLSMSLGIGIYSIPEASRLIGVPGQNIRRWLFGYHYRKLPGDATTRTDMAPLWTPELADEDFDENVIGFRDLLELRFVQEFIRHGVSTRVIRRCLENAKTLFGVSHPMTLKRFQTDGKTIYAEALEEEALENSLVDLKSRQSVFKAIIKPSLYAGIVYDELGAKARKWYPDATGKGRSPVVIDPARQFGAPIIEDTGTPTNVLYSSYVAEGEDTGALTITARVYDVSSKLVSAAIRFEQSLEHPPH
ncbi:MAG: DUF433 domain-containing protein [Burkholderiaceae bacterium]|nr:DUF433 domain-containing protein [Burkholderiaceae bacterium]